MGDLFDLTVERHWLSVVCQVGAASPAEALAMVDESLVTPDRLYAPSHQAVLTTALELLREGKPADAVSLWTRLKANTAVSSAGGVTWLTDLANEFSVEAAAPSYALTIRQLALRRHLRRLGVDLAARAESAEQDPAETLTNATKALASVQVSRAADATLSDAMTDMLCEMEDNACGKRLAFVPTGLVELDNVLGGGLPSRILTLVGAQPGVGKSALLATIVHSAAQAGVTVGVFSLEDEKRWLAYRVTAKETRIPQAVLKRGKLEGRDKLRLVKALDTINAYSGRVLIDDRGGLTPREVVQQATHWIVSKGAQLIVVDHMGELRWDSKAERLDTQIGDGLREIRDVAKRHGIPVLVASQLARRPGKGPEDKPAAGDFKNSGDIEAIARVMLGLYREKGSDELGIHVIKNTGGQAGGDLALRFVGLAGMVADCEDVQPRDFYAEQMPDKEPAHDAR